MPEPIKIERAELRELLPNGEESQDNRLIVQFNPELLKVSFANQVVPPENQAGAAGSGPRASDQRGTTATQFVGKGTTKLSVQLWFDVTGALPQAQASESDVRQITKKVAYFITPKPSPGDANKFIPPGVRFLWGTFKFDGIMESLEESLEFFSPDGKPLRSSVTLSLTQQEIQFLFGESPNAQANNTRRSPAGTQPLTPAPAGSTLQGLAARQGGGGNNWQAIAQANGIENPRLLQPGQLINMNVGR